MQPNQIKHVMYNFGFSEEFIEAYICWKTIVFTIFQSGKVNKKKHDEIVFTCLRFSYPDASIIWLEDFPKVYDILKECILIGHENTFNKSDTFSFKETRKRLLIKHNFKSSNIFHIKDLMGDNNVSS